MDVQSQPLGECLLAMDDRRTARLLELTGRQRAPVLLSVRSLPDQEALNGLVVSVDAESIYVRLDETTATDRQALSTACCDVGCIVNITQQPVRNRHRPPLITTHELVVTVRVARQNG